MLRSFTVKNFRCFQNLTLEGLERVNLIAGKNNSGKTALLEAIQLHCNPNNCRLPLDIYKARGIEEPLHAAQELATWLFFKKNSAEAIALSSVDDQGKAHSLEIWLRDPITARDKFKELVPTNRQAFPDHILGQQLGQQAEVVLLLHYRTPDGVDLVSAGAGGGGSGRNGFSWTGVAIPWEIPNVLLSSTGPVGQREIHQFSELELIKRSDEVTASLKPLDARLRRLTLLLLGETLAVYGDVDLPRLIPLALMGEGIRRLFSIIVAIASTAGGIVLIDEVENGLHYSMLKSAWQAIATAARQANTQVIATTHSWECIRAAHEAFKERDSYEFRYHRLDRLGEQIAVKSLDRRMLDAVEKSDLEIR